MAAGRVVVGAGLITVGAVYLLATFTDFDPGPILARWWPVILVALGLVQLAVDRRALMGSAVLVVLGLVLLAFTTGVATGSVWSVLWPTVLVLAGLALVTARTGGPPESAGEAVRGFAVFSSRRLSSRSARLRGGELTAILGTVEVDLTEATLVPDARLAVTAVLGACEVVVPHGWDVHISGIPVLGMWDDTTQRNDLPPGAPVLRVHAVAVLGAVEVRHASRWK